MATPVPYNPQPQVAPRDIPTPYLHEDTPIGAFGGLTAQAIAHMGQATEGAGKEIFTRGLAMQQLDREAATNEANANYVTSSGLKLEKFKELRGQAATEGLTPFLTDLNKSREDVKATLRDPYSQLLFDQESRRMQSWLTMSAAAHAGEQHTKYVLGSLKASNDAADNLALGDPLNERAFQYNLNKKWQNNNQEAIINGLSDEERKNNWDSLRNDLYAARFQGLAKDRPFTARTMADEAIADGQLTGKAAYDTLDYINKLRATVGARQAALEIHSGDNLALGAGAIPLTRAREGIKAVESGGDYGSNPGYESERWGHPLGAYQVMSKNLAPWLKEAGLPAMTEAEFLKNPGAQDQLFDFKFGQYMRETGSFNKAADLWFGRGDHDALGTTHAVYLARANAGLARSASLDELAARGDRRAEELAPGDDMFKESLLTHIESIYSKDQRVQKVNEQNNTNTVYEALGKELQTNKVAIDFDKLKHSSPEVEAAINAMPWKEQLQLQKNVISINNSFGKQTEKAIMDAAIGLYAGSDDDRKEFAKLKPWQMPISISDMQRIATLQRQLQGGNIGDTEAMTLARAQLDAVGISSYDKVSENRFRGALIESMRAWKEQHPGKAITADDVKGMTSDLLTKETSPNFWYGKDFLFNLPLPTALVDKIKKETPDIDDAELERRRQVYVRDQFQALQKTKAQAP